MVASESETLSLPDNRDAQDRLSVAFRHSQFGWRSTVIPRSSIEIWYSEVPKALPVPTQPDALTEYLDGNREYDSSFAYSAWQDAEEALSIERGAVSGARSATSPEDFDERLDDYDENEDLLALGGLDAGVAGLTLVLNAAGCVTTTSCRSHPRRPRAGIDYPQVRFYASSDRASILAGLAMHAGTGFAVDNDGVLEVWAPSVTEMMKLAAAVLGEREVFDALPPRWPES